MKSTRFLLLLFLFVILGLFSEQVSAGESREIELTDRSLIIGEVLSFQNGTYTIQSESI